MPSTRPPACHQPPWVQQEFDPQTYLMHDVPPDVLATVTPKGPQSTRPFRDQCTFDEWPAPETVIAGRDDRMFPVDFQTKLALERLGVEAVITRADTSPR